MFLLCIALNVYVQYTCSQHQTKCDITYIRDCKNGNDYNPTLD